MNTIFHHGKGNFTIIPNVLINDSELPVQSRFMFIYLYSKPPNWKFYTPQLCKALGMHKDTFRKYRRVLIEKGWILVEEQHHSNGKFNSRIYHLHNQPQESKLSQISADENDDNRELQSQNSTVTQNNNSGNNCQPNNTNIREKETSEKKDLEDIFNNENFDPNPRQK